MIILYSKSIRLYVGSGFLVLHRGLRKPRTLTAFHRWGLCLTIIGGLFTHGRIYPFLLIPDTYFFTILFNRVTQLDIVPFTELAQSNTKHSVDFTNHALTPFNAMSLCICNARGHCTLYRVTCIMNATWTILLMHITNASWEIISTCI